MSAVSAKEMKVWLNELAWLDEADTIPPLRGPVVNEVLKLIESGTTYKDDRRILLLLRNALSKEVDPPVGRHFPLNAFAKLWEAIINQHLEGK